MSIENRAKIDATRMHASINHRRKYTNQPYIVHPAEVVRIASTSKLVTPAGKAAGWLHDVVEDVFKGRRAEGLAWVLARHGQRVHDLVEMMSDPEDYPEKANRWTRTRINREHSAQADAEGQTLKVADLISNAKDIVKHDPDFAVVFLAEKRKLLRLLTKADRKLWNIAWELANQPI